MDATNHLASLLVSYVNTQLALPLSLDVHIHYTHIYVYICIAKARLPLGARNGLEMLDDLRVNDCEKEWRYFFFVHLSVSWFRILERELVTVKATSELSE